MINVTFCNDNEFECMSEAIIEKMKAYNEANKESIKAYHAAYDEANKKSTTRKITYDVHM